MPFVNKMRIKLEGFELFLHLLLQLFCLIACCLCEVLIVTSIDDAAT